MNILLTVVIALAVTICVNIIFVKELTKELKKFEDRLDKKRKMLRK